MSRWGLEAFGPLIAFSPFFSGPVRCLVILSFMIFHFSMGLALELWLFTYICMASLVIICSGLVLGPILRKVQNSGSGCLFPNAGAGNLEEHTRCIFSDLRSDLEYQNGLSITFLSQGCPVNWTYSEIRSVVGVFRGPSRKDGWHVIVGKLQDGTQVNPAQSG